MGQVSGKIALVTGGAVGIGKACALTLAREGASVIVTDVDAAGAEAVAVEIRANGGKAIAAHQDVVDEERWAEIVKLARSEFGGLHILVNNAGVGIMESTFKMTLEKFRWQNAINVDGVFLGCKHAIPCIAKSGGGSVINLSSVAGLQGTPMMAGYSASKGAVRLMSKSIALECAMMQNKVRVNSVHPGIIDTAIWDKIPAAGEMPADRSNQGPLVATDLASNMSPVGYAGTAQNVADGVLFLASDASSYMTGSELVIDGGITAR